jgi:outer membrane protein with beta-barrel domain
MRRSLRIGILLAAAVVLTASPALAQKFEVTPYYGYRLGGDFDSFSTAGVDKLEIKDGDAWGLILTYNLHPGASIEFQYTQQSTTLDGHGALFTPATEDLFDLNVEYWMIGGAYTTGDEDQPARGFVGFALGWANFEPHSSRFDGDSEFSFSLYGGVKIALAKHIGLRLQGQWFSTWVGSGTDVFCDPFGFCYSVQSGGYLNQFEVASGLAFKF